MKLVKSYVPADRSEPIQEITIGDALRSAAERWSDRVALVSAGGEVGRRSWTFGELLATAQRVARALLGSFRTGEHVAVWAANCPEWIQLEMGAALAGITLVTVNPAYQGGELAYVLGRSKACGVLVQPSYRGRDLLAVANTVRADLPRLREVISLSDWDDFVSEPPAHELPEVRPDDIAQIQYTSGTTGFPKGAELTHRGLVNVARLYAEVNNAGPDDVWANPMPLFHTAGCGLVTLGALQTGGTQVLPPGFDPAVMLDLMERERATLVLCVPTMLIRLLAQQAEKPRDLSDWRLVMLGGAPIAPDLVRRAHEIAGVGATIGFGQTEASPYLTHTRPDDPHPDWISTVGPPLPQTEIRISDPDTGATTPIGVVGEICARSSGVMNGYFDDPQETARAIDGEGWLHTGDLGSVDEHGYVRVQGRLKDMIIRGGENIYPREIEDLLFTHPVVADAAVIGVPDQEMGEKVVAFVKPKSGAHPDADDLRAFCRRHLASYKTPREWRFVDDFPMTASGKIRKYVLREKYIAE